MSSPADKVLQSFIKKFGKLPDQPNQLVSYSRSDVEIPTIIYSEAKKSLSKITKSIKSGKIKKQSFKTSTKWTVGDEVLISKDRTGVLRYIGQVPEMGDNETYYGIELTSGTIGHNDGAIKGKRYFQTTGKRGMFIPGKKLRRRLNKKDKNRRNSYHEISGHVKQLQKDYAGDDAAWLYHGNNPPAQVSPNTQNLHTLVFETAEPDEEYGYNNGDNREYEENDDIKVKKSDRKKKKIIREKKKIKEKVTRERRNTGGSSSSNSSRYRNRVDTSSDSDNGSDDTDISELNDNESKDDPTVKTFDTVLKYILRQKGQYREGLLDVYANPQTHALIVEAFSQMKQLQSAEQAFLWPALLKRWSKYTHRI